MSLDSVIKTGANTAGTANVDANYNLNVTLPTTPTQAGFALMATEFASASDPSGRIINKAEVTSQGRVHVGIDVPSFNETFNGTLLNTSLWSNIATTMASTVAGGALNINATAITTINTNQTVTTKQFFSMYSDWSIGAEWEMTYSAVPQANCVMEVGFGLATAATAPTDGAFFRFDATGTLKAVINNNGTEITSAALTVPSANARHSYEIKIEDDKAFFFIDGACQSVINTPTSQGRPVMAESLPFYARQYIAGVAPTLGNALKIHAICVYHSSLHHKPVNLMAAVMGRSAYQTQTGGAAQAGAPYVPATNVAAGAATATAVPVGHAAGFGGYFNITAQATGATDNIVTSFQNPAGTAAVSGRNLVVTGIRIQCSNEGAAVATTATQIMWGLAFGHTAISLATTEQVATGAATTSKAPRKMFVGMSSWATAAAIGAPPVEGAVFADFSQAPIVVYPGEFIASTARFVVGTATASQAILGIVTLMGYYE